MRRFSTSRGASAASGASPPSRSVASNMAKRVAFAAVAMPAVLGLAYLGGWYLAGLLAVFGALGAR